VVLIAALAISGCEESESVDWSTRTPTATEDAIATLVAQSQRTTPVPTATPLTPTATATATYTPTLTPSPSLTPSPTPTPSVTNTPAPTPTHTATQVIYATNTPRATQVMLNPVTPTLKFAFDGSDMLNDHYWFARPFRRDPGSGLTDYASRSYPYGATGYGQFQVHHGVDISNPLGTSILAVSSGTVFYAGDDSEIMFGPKNDFYGNLVVIEHDIAAPNGEPLYTLYGHMSRVDVEEGQRVDVQARIGQVGATGVALGSHLHLEVRIGDPYDYGQTYNPDLWLRPWPRYGTLAGRVTDGDGDRVYDAEITIHPQDGSGPDRYAFSYADDSVNPDPYYGEHYTRGDLPAGEYTVFVRVRGVRRFEREVTVESGQTNWLDITLR